MKVYSSFVHPIVELFTKGLDILKAKSKRKSVCLDLVSGDRNGALEKVYPRC